jgi:glutamate-1-semialdehyde 2,1-aminomutase
LTTLGKVIGGGLNIGAYGGPRRLMERIAPAGPVYQAGTLSGSPLAVAAGLATLAQLSADNGALYRILETTSARLATGIADAAARAGVPCRVHRVGSMLGVFLTAGEVRSLPDVDGSDRPAFGRLFHSLLAAGVHLPPSAYETVFVSAAHGSEEVDLTLEAFAHAFAGL